MDEIHKHYKRLVLTSAFVIELSEAALLIISVSGKNITFYTKNSDDVYEYVGDQTFENTEFGKLNVRIFSPKIESVTLGLSKTLIKEPLELTKDINLTLSL